MEIFNLMNMVIGEKERRFSRNILILHMHTLTITLKKEMYFWHVTNG